MTTKLTQAVVDKASGNHPQGTQLYDDEVSGLRLVVGKKSCSWKLVGRINDGTDRYISIIIGRSDEVSIKTARTRATELRLALRRGDDPRRRKVVVPTVMEALERYLASRTDLRPRTREWYRDITTRCLASVTKLPIDRIDKDMARSLHEKLTKTNGPTAANGSMRVLKLLFNDVARTHDLPPNPVSRAVRLHREEPRDWAVAPADMPDLWRRIDALEDPIRRVCWMTMLLTGLRCGDARRMRWDQIDEDGVLTVPCPKGGERKAFKLPLSKLLLDELETLRALTKPLASEWVYPSSIAKSGHVEGMLRSEAFPYSPHAMRHTFRTFALEAGIDIGMTMVLMNHRPAGVTWNYVTRSNLVGPMREAAEKIAAKVASYRQK